MRTGREPNPRNTKLWPHRLRYGLVVGGSLAVCAIYLGSVVPSWYPTSDSALYRMLGHNLARGAGYTLWGQPHVHVPPGLPLWLAAMEKCGLGNDWWLNLGLATMALATLWIAYAAMRRQTDRVTAILVTGVVGFSTTMHLASIRQLSEVPYMLTLWTSVLLLLRGLRSGSASLELGSLMMIASVWIRIAGFPLAAAASLGLLWERSRIPVARQRINALLIAGGVTLSAGLFFAGHRAATASQALPSYGNAITRMLERSTWSWITSPFVHAWRTNGALAELFLADDLSNLGAWVGLVWVPLLLGLVWAIRKRQSLAAAMVIGYLGMILLHRPLLARYLLPISPLLVLCSFYGHRWMISRWRGTRQGRAAVVVIASLLILLNAPRTVRTAYRLHHPHLAKGAAEWHSTHEAAEQLRRLAGTEDRFVSSWRERTLSFLSHVSSLPLGRSPEFGAHYQVQDLRQWIDQGVSIAVINRDHTRNYYGQLFTDQMLRSEGFQPVFSNQRFDIYRREQDCQGNPSVAWTGQRP